jgi:hypothetical protein
MEFDGASISVSEKHGMQTQELQVAAQMQARNPRQR